MFSQALGTALGDWTADTAGLGYLGAATIVVAYHFTNLCRTLLFWAAFILTRPLGAVVGDFLDKPIAKGGLDLSRFSASAALLFVIVACILFFPQPAAKNSSHYS